MPDRPLPPAIVTAMNVNGLGVARVLGRHGVPVIGIHESDPGVEVRTRFLKDRWQRGAGTAALLELLRAKGPDFADRPVLIPITDESVTVIADHLDELRRHYRIAMPAPELVRELLDKERMHALAERLGVPVPRTWNVGDEAALQRVADEIVFPCIVKPVSKDEVWLASGLHKAYVLEDRQALLDTWREIAVAAPRVVVQQFVPGGDEQVCFTLLYCREGGDAAGVFSGRKLRQWRPRCGGTSACEPVDGDAAAELDAMARRFFAEIGMHGLCSLEYKRDPRDGACYMIEPTVCRPDWQNGVADCNGVPLAWLAYCDLAGLGMPAVRRRSSPRRWVYLAWDRLAAGWLRERGELGRLAWLWSIRPPVRGAVFALDDPRPWLATVGATWWRLCLRIGRLFGARRASGRAA